MLAVHPLLCRFQSRTHFSHSRCRLGRLSPLGCRRCRRCGCSFLHPAGFGTFRSRLRRSLVDPRLLRCCLCPCLLQRRSRRIHCVAFNSQLGPCRLQVHPVRLEDGFGCRQLLRPSVQLAPTGPEVLGLLLDNVLFLFQLGRGGLGIAQRVGHVPLSTFQLCPGLFEPTLGGRNLGFRPPQRPLPSVQSFPLRSERLLLLGHPLLLGFQLGQLLGQSQTFCFQFLA